MDSISDPSNTTSLLVGGAVFLTSFYSVSWYRRRRRNPPGPSYLPILGNYNTFHENEYLYKTLDKYAKQYGELCYMRVGPYPVVLISSAEKIRYMFVEHKTLFSDRANFAPIDIFMAGGKGLARASYEDSKVNRKFTMQALRDFGMGKSSFEGKMQNEAQILTTELLLLNGESFDPNFIIAKAVSNIIFLLVASKRNDYKDEKFISLMNTMNLILEKNGLGYRTFGFLPVCALKLISTSLNSVLMSYDAMKKYIFEMIKDHQDNFDPNSINNFLDVYIQHIQDNNDQVQMENLQEIIVDLLLAGAETTTTTLRFFMFYMCKYPHVQEKCRKEISEIGFGRMIKLSDKKLLTYNHAMINELQRVSCIAPIALAHTVDKDITLDGYSYDKNTLFIGNFYGCMRDEKAFPEPDEFKPERWIGYDGELITPPAEFMPFGIGPRSCMGDVLARSELFLFTTTILQRLNLKYDGPIIQEDIQMGITRKIRQKLDIIATPVI